MPDSQNPEHVRKLIREFQLKGANLIPTLTGEIVPVVLVADLSVAGDRSADRPAVAGQIATAAGAGNQNTVRLINPAGSGVVLVVERVEAHQLAADQFDIRVETGIVAGAAGVWRDTRLPGTPIGSTTATAIAGAVVGPLIYRLLATRVSTVLLDWIIAPNRALSVRQNNLDDALHVNFYWRERDQKPGD